MRRLLLHFIVANAAASSAFVAPNASPSPTELSRRRSAGGDQSHSATAAHCPRFAVGEVPAASRRRGGGIIRAPRDDRGGIVRRRRPLRAADPHPVRRASLSVCRDAIAADLPAEGGADEIDDAPGESSSESGSEEPTQTLSQATFNLIKACVGSGVLALPAGVAAMGDVPLTLVPASAMLIFLGALSSYSFFMLGRLSHFSDHTPRSFGDAWEREVGPDSAWIVVLSCLLTPFGAALAYSIMLGDMFCSVAQTAGLKGILATRQASILAVTLGILYPLCNLKSLAALAPVSMVGIAGICVTCVYMTMRLISGAYSPGGAFFDSIAPSLQPSFGAIGLSKVFTPSALVLGGMAATAYLVHFSAHDFYNGLEKKSLKQFGLLSALGFAGTCAISVLMMSLGFLTFGGNSAGLILNNYSTRDWGATLCRLVMAVSLIGSYPIFFRGIKSAFIDLVYRGKDITEDFNKRLTKVLLATLTGLSLVLKNAGFMVSFTGALMGSAIIYIFPPIMYLKSTSRRIREGKMSKTKLVHLERTISKIFIGLGALMGVIGGTVTVLDAFFPHLL